MILRGQRCRQVGNICMDQCMFEVDMRTYANRQKLDPQIGDEVLLVGREGNSIVTIGRHGRTRWGTINYEVAIGFGHRMPRLYV